MKKELGHEAIYDARQLGTPRMLVLGLQHMFAMFGATVLVPILVQGYGLPLSIQTTLLFAGLGTLLFHVCTKMKVPAFLGSSFAYLGGFETVAQLDEAVWGPGFEAPVFSDEVEVITQRLVGARHLKLSLRMQGTVREGIWFGRSEPLPARAQLAYRLNLDEFQGRQRVQMVVEGLAD